MKDKAILTTGQVAKIVFGSLEGVFKENINRWDSPIRKIVDEVIEENRDKIKAQFQKAFDMSFGSKDFEKTIQQEFIHKVAKNLIGKLEGEVEKTANVLRGDPTIRAKMLLAIKGIIEKQLKVKTEIL